MRLSELLTERAQQQQYFLPLTKPGWRACDPSISGKKVFPTRQAKPGWRACGPSSRREKVFLRLLVGQCQFGMQSEQLVDRGDDALAAVLEMVEVVAEVEAHQVDTDEPWTVRPGQVR